MTIRQEEDSYIIPTHSPQSGKNTPWADQEQYRRMYKESIDDPEKFWSQQAEIIDWFKKWDVVKDIKYSKEDTHIKWYQGAKLNVCYNCVDRHLEKRSDQTAIIWEGDDPTISKKITYQQLHHEVCKFSNILKELGVKKGDKVTIYMPMILEASYAMLACARIGAVHCVVFGGFSPEALKGRIVNSDSKIIITADYGIRGGKNIPLKDNVDKAIEDLSDVKTLVIKNTGEDINWRENHDNWYHQLYEQVDANCVAEEMEAEDELFILYTSGSTGVPKGIVHTTGGYIVYATLTHRYIFDYHADDLNELTPPTNRNNSVYWCTADVGWVTGHSYIIYGPLANGATTLMFEGVPNYPSASRFWDVIDKHQVNIFYTAPTAIRSLMALGDEFVKRTDRSSLRILGSVGEPINPEAWRWYYEVVGDGKCPIVDTWWQTETGGILISPLPYATKLKAGSAATPFFGIRPEVIDADGNILEGECEGSLCMADSWPGQMRSVIGDHQRFIDTYFSQFEGKYFSGDGCRRDKDGYYWITGRTDDVLNVSGHRLGTAEIESAMVAHQSVAEAAVVGYHHDIKGQGIYIYVTLNKENQDSTNDSQLRNELTQLVRVEIGAFAKPDYIHFTPELPKTRSGKIMRRILRKIAENKFDDIGDTSTLLNPDIVEKLISSRLNR